MSEMEELRMAKIGTGNPPNPATPPGGHPAPIVKPPRPGK